MIAVPLAGALLLVPIPRSRTGWILGVALLSLAVVLAIGTSLATADPAALVATSYEAQLQWLASPSITLHLGLDGLSLLPLLLTPLIGGAALLAGWSEAGDRTRELAAGLLLLVSCLEGVFASLDLITYALFLQVAILALAHLMAGSGRCGDRPAAMHLALVNLVGAVAFVAGTTFLQASCQRLSGMVSYDLAELSGASLPAALQIGLFLAFFSCFALQMSLVPLHGWMVRALGEGSITGAVALAGLWPMTGAYGLVRIGLSLFPAAGVELAVYGAVLAAGGVVYGGLLALVQPDLRRRLAYANVAFSGLFLLGMCSLAASGVLGSALLVLGQSPLRALLVLLAVVLGGRAMAGPQLGISWREMAAACWLVGVLALVGSPAFSAFHGQVLLLVSAAAVHPVASGVALAGMVLVGVALLYPFVGMGRSESPAHRLGLRLGLAAALLMAAALGGGLYPRPWVEWVEAGLYRSVSQAGLKVQAEATVESGAAGDGPNTGGVEESDPGGEGE